MKIFVLFVFCGWVAAFLMKDRVFINSSPSMPVGVWVKSDEPIAEGSFVAFCPTKDQAGERPQYGSCDGGYQPFLKEVRQLEGSKAFVVGHHELSLDSNTFGFIDVSQVITAIRPLITLEERR